MFYSVIIPVYNSTESLFRAIDSVLKQTLLAGEIIIVDDGSTSKKTKEILSDLRNDKSDSIFIFEKPNGGAASARNFGGERASGDWLAFLDADDEWESEKMHLQLDYLLKNTQYKSIATIITPIPNWADAKLNKIIELKLRDQLIRNHIQTSTFVIDKLLFLKINGFPENQTHAEEGDLYFKNLQFANIPIILRSLVKYGDGVVEFNQSGLSGDTKKMYEGEKKNLRRLYERSQVSLITYFVSYTFSFLKYLRRLYTRRS